MTKGQRLQMFINHLNHSKNSFAISIGVSSTVINGIVNDSHNPGLKVINAIKNVYPEFNTDWLQTGKGEMIDGMEAKPADTNYLQEYLLRLEEQFKALRDQLSVKDTQIADLTEMLKMTLGKLDPASEKSKVKTLWDVPPVLEEELALALA